VFAHMCTPWSLGNLYTVHMQRQRESSRRFKVGTCQLREKTLTEEHRFFRIVGVGVGLTTQPRQMICRESNTEERRPGPTQGSRATDEHDNENK
jgi:hypothetical protein